MPGSPTSYDRSRLLRLCLALAALAWVILRVEPKWEGDTYIVYEGLNSIFRWLGGSAAETPTRFGPFAVFQYLTGAPVMSLARAGIGIEILRYWSVCSTIALGGMVWLAVRSGHERLSAGSRWLMAVLLVTGLPLAYAASTFNELPAAALTMGLVAAAAGRGRAWQCGLICFAAALTKDVAAPLLLLLWLGGLSVGGGARLRMAWRGHLLSGVIATVAAFGTHATFNLVRFGSPFNEHYLRLGKLVPYVTWQLDNAAAIWVAPNGGVLWYWPTWLTLAALLVVASLRRSAESPSERGASRFWPLLAALGTLALVTFGLSKWFAPFGWWCWGPRLLLPWLPATLLLLALACPAAANKAARQVLAGRAAFVLTSTVLLALAIPHFVTLYDTGPTLSLYTPVPLPAPREQLSEAQYEHEMVHELAWNHRPLQQAPAYSPAAMKAVAIPMAVYAVAVVLLLAHARPLIRDGE